MSEKMTCPNCGKLTEAKELWPFGICIECFSEGMEERMHAILDPTFEIRYNGKYYSLLFKGSARYIKYESGILHAEVLIEEKLAKKLIKAID